MGPRDLPESGFAFRAWWGTITSASPALTIAGLCLVGGAAERSPAIAVPSAIVLAAIALRMRNVRLEVTSTEVRAVNMWHGWALHWNIAAVEDDLPSFVLRPTPSDSRLRRKSTATVSMSRRQRAAR